MIVSFPAPPKTKLPPNPEYKASFPAPPLRIALAVVSLRIWSFPPLPTTETCRYGDRLELWSVTFWLKICWPFAHVSRWSDTEVEV
jgi:hypothetical protein